MLFSVSTIKDNVGNVEAFVQRNLAHGIDHMFVFLDDSQAEVTQYLQGQPAVTCVEAYGAWWAGARPTRLNRRQNTNADVVKGLLTQLEGDHWLFHIDGDEIISVDRERLEGLPADIRVVHLNPLEAVSEEQPAARPTQFKRLLTEQELHLLKLLGIVSEPSNDVYFHGHVGGKAGFRPALDLYAGIHAPLDAQREPIEGFTADWLEQLHLESVSLMEFQRKWVALVESGPRPSIRSPRRTTYCAVEALMNLGVSGDVADRYLRELYLRTTQDPVRQLHELKLLREMDPDDGTYEPRPVPTSDLGACREALRLLRDEPKAVFRLGSAREVQDALDRAWRP